MRLSGNYRRRRQGTAPHRTGRRFARPRRARAPAPGWLRPGSGKGGPRQRQACCGGEFPNYVGVGTIHPHKADRP